jgi:hypothetical protein
MMSTEEGFAPGPAIRHACVEGLWVVLDLEHESYSVLDEVASSMWAELIVADSVAEAARRVAERWDEDPARVEGDVREFVDDCRERGWLRDAAALPGRDSRLARGPRIAGAARALAATRWSLRRHGLRATYERCAALPAGRDARGLDAAAAAFRGAESAFLSRRGPDDCLVRSLALFRFLRERGIAADHVIGVERVPFTAHAWVESGGAPVLEFRRRLDLFTPLARLSNERASTQENAGRP